MSKLFLLRYDTEGGPDSTEGFLDKVAEVHRADRIPVTLFCTGNAIDSREGEFRRFHAAVGDDPLFDLQNHSYSHIGPGVRGGQAG